MIEEGLKREDVNTVEVERSTISGLGTYVVTEEGNKEGV